MTMFNKTQFNLNFATSRNAGRWRLFAGYLLQFFGGLLQRLADLSSRHCYLMACGPQVSTKATALIYGIAEHERRRLLNGAFNLNTRFWYQNAISKPLNSYDFSCFALVIS